MGHIFVAISLFFEYNCRTCITRVVPLMCGSMKNEKMLSTTVRSMPTYSEECGSFNTTAKAKTLYIL